jgi:hypothetical protein
MILRAKVLLCCLLSVCIAGNIATARGDQLLIADKSKTTYVISLAQDAIPAEKTAATQLQEYLRLSTGVTLDIKSEETVPQSKPQILVGAGPRVKSLLPNENWKALARDEIIIKSVGKNLVLAGSRPRGALYAVFQFLEEQVGVRWWTPTEQHVPRHAQLKIPELNITYKPPFTYREHFTNTVVDDPLFAARMRENGENQKQDATLGGHSTILGWVHTFDKLLPPHQYFKDHPEWYSDVNNGNKPCTATSQMPEPQNSQLNLENEAMRRELTRNALAWIKQNPAAGLISISQNDNTNWCRTPYEEAMAEKEGSPSGAILTFVNAVAADIEKEYPGFQVETLAYHYTQKASATIRPRNNVVIRLCSINADFSRPLDSDANSAFRDDLLQWKTIAPRLYVWNYAGNFNNWLFPAPNMKPLAANLRFFVQNNVIGVFEQGDGYSNGTGDFIQLRTWLTSRLLWNPFQNEDELTSQFLEGYYGKAAPYLQEYLDLIHEEYLKTGQRLGISPTNHQFLTLDVMNRATKLFDDAGLAVKDSPELSRRLRRTRLSLDHAWILRYNTLRQLASAEGKPFAGPTDISQFVAQFIKTANDFGIINIEEHGTFASYSSTLAQRFAPSAPLPVALQELVPADKRLMNLLDVQDINLDLITANNEIAVVDDPLAVDQKTVRIDGTSQNWATKLRLQDIPQSFLGEDNWSCYLVARIEYRDGDAATRTVDSLKTGDALKSGLYDYANLKPVTEKTFGLADVNDKKYETLRLGDFRMTPGMYLWVSGAANPTIKAIYIDRIILIRN